MDSGYYFFQFEAFMLSFVAFIATFNFVSSSNHENDNRNLVFSVIMGIIVNALGQLLIFRAM
jgi:hypothetical protein